ncbi:cytochrome P450 [Rhizobium sp. L1K21]|uniref:cytochrome P450 n=1 Tax=Rhizobium sp. L1K21 TaxID=2954933 RepID=UPI002092A12C|nr:cytochrome P450 [Rhizobium sp. L1K21]MCO6187943.1 cytochrome P450 [Rhizobium sp. L1K21]
MDKAVEYFEPAAPIPRNTPPSGLDVVRVTMRNPLELWGEPSYNEPVIQARFFGQHLTIANHPGLVRHVLVDNAARYGMQPVRQLVLKPILREGLLTAEGENWKRSRKAMAPVFTPRHARGFAQQMLAQSVAFADRLEEDASRASEINASALMTQLTYEVLAETLFSGGIARSDGDLGELIDNLLKTMGRVDPMDLIQAPRWIPRLLRLRGLKTLRGFRDMVSRTMDQRKAEIASGKQVPDDFLTLLLGLEGEAGLNRNEIEDNILTFIGAGHETTARALGWTLYCLAGSPHFRSLVEEEIDRVLATGADPVEWLDLMPHVRSAFEEAMRLYPPASNIGRAPLEDDSWTDENGKRYDLPAGEAVVVLPWVLHRHNLYWENPRQYRPERFLPGAREKIGRFQYLPFGAGPRICIGATFALQEAAIALATLLGRFRFDMTENTRPWPVQRLTVQPAGGLPMRISHRH